MNRDYAALPSHLLKPGAALMQPEPPRVRLQLSSPALSVMTDLTRVPAATIDPEAPLDAANRFMIRRNVRLLLVTEDRQSEVLGLITATDILGEKPVQIAVERGMRRQDLRVRDLMTPRERLEVIDFADLAHAEVGHIVATLKQAGRQHLLVAHRGAGAKMETVRGIFSLSQIARQLGVVITSTEVAQSFAEIEAAIAH